MRVRDDQRARKGKVATGIVTKSEDGKCDVKYDDGSTRSGVPASQLRPLEKLTRDFLIRLD